MPGDANWRREIAAHLEGLRLTPEREAEIIDELSGHLNDEYQRLLAAGAGEEEAREIALEGLDDRPPLAEAMRRVKREPARDPIPMGTPPGNAGGDLWRDLKYALRAVKRGPGFAALVVLSLALGIGGNTAMFRIVSAVLIRPLPYADPERLVQAVNSGYYPLGGLVDLQQESRTMDFAGYSPGIELNIASGGEPWRVRGSEVSANLFQVLGAGVQMGRTFLPGEDRAGRERVVILSHQLWQDRFGGNANVVGRVLMLGGVSRRVVGVAQRGFAFPDAATRFWIPLEMDPRDLTAYWAHSFIPLIARLRSGVSLAQAKAEIASLSMAMLRLFPYPMGRDWAASMTVVPLQETMTANVRVKLLVLQCAVALVLLIACANIASLLLARATSRQREIALRVALGASRARIVRQLLTESVVLAVTGGLLGMGFAVAGHSALQSALGRPAAGGDDGGWQILAFAGALSLLTGLICGLAPALAALRQDIALTIKTGRAGAASVARARVRSALIVGEVALAVVLTISAGLLIRSLWKLALVNPGFRAEHVLTLRVSPDQSLCRDRLACVALYNELLRRVKEIGGVENAAAANTLPLAASIPASPVKVEGLPYVPAERAAPMFWAGAVTPDYFGVMGIPVLEGRPLTAADGDKAEPVIVVSAATAARYWPGENPVGKHIQLVWEDQWRKVVGIAADVRQFDLADRPPDYIRGSLYMPYAQAVDSDRQLPAAMTLTVRTHADPSVVASGVRDLVRQLNPNVPVDEVRTMMSVVNESTGQPRSLMWLFIGFAAMALALAAVGAYGVVSYSTAQRMFEIGVRMALGAGRRSVFGLVLGQSLRLVAAGLALGLAASLAVTRLLSTFLYATAPTDPLTLACACGVLVVVGLAAGFVPARRAAGVDPLIALRTE